MVLNRKLRIRVVVVGFVVGFCLGNTNLRAVAGQMATLEERSAGAEKVVVATTRRVEPEWRTNEHGDRLIVSRVQLEVDETIKGKAEAAVWMELEGGTLDGLTLQVSSLPLLRPGERAVFFLNSTERGVSVPHLRGQGILLLDSNNIVRGTSLRLDEVRGRIRVTGK